MIRINQIKLPPEHTKEDILKKAAKVLRIDPGRIEALQIVRKSIDARKKTGYLCGLHRRCDGKRPA